MALLVVISAIAPHILVAFVALITFGITGFILFLYFQSTDAVRMEVNKTPSGAVEVWLHGNHLDVVNPQVIYFGVDTVESGEQFLCLGIPTTDGRPVVLTERIESEVTAKDLPAFAIPISLGTPKRYQSKSTYPGELTSIVRLMGFF